LDVLNLGLQNLLSGQVDMLDSLVDQIADIFDLELIGTQLLTDLQKLVPNLGFLSFCFWNFTESLLVCFREWVRLLVHTTFYLLLLLFRSG
jgi:hypothetical protein